MKNVFVVLEGLSGSGKTTIGKMVAQKIGGVFYKTPSLLFEEIRDKVDRQANITARFLFYLAGIVQSSEEISYLLNNKSVICDRYFLTTFCYHKILEVDVESCLKFIASFQKPDFSFLIDCQENKRAQRLKKRGMSYNDKQEVKFQLNKKLLFEYKQNNLIEIDNSGNDPEIAVDQIISFLK